MSGSKRPGLSVSEIEALQAKGYTQMEIAELRAVTRQAVNDHLARAGKTNLNKRISDFPFQVPAAMQQTHYKRLRDHYEFKTKGADDWSYEKRRRLRNWYKKLRDNNWVIEFDPDLPPEPGVSTRGGWALRPREKKDGDLMIRVNRHTELTERGRAIYVMPAPDAVP